MPDLIEIEGDCVTIYNKSITRQHNLKDWLEFATKTKSAITPLLPLPACRKYSRDLYDGSPRHTFVIEQQPTIKMVEWRWESRTNENPTPPHHIYRLAMPFFIFIVRTNETAVLDSACQAYVRVAPLGVSKEGAYGPTDLFAPPLPNIGQAPGHYICPGSAKIKAGQSPALLAQDFVANFWASKINRDLQDNWTYFAQGNERFRNQELWQKETEANPFSILEARFAHSSTLEDQVR